MVGCLVTKSCPTLVTPWTVACQAPLSMGFSRQEYWLPFPSPGDLPDPGIEPGSPALQADSLLTELQGKPHTTTHMKCHCKQHVIKHKPKNTATYEEKTLSQVTDYPTKVLVGPKMAGESCTRLI